MKATGLPPGLAEAVLDEITTSVITADAAGRVTFINRNALETLRRSWKECEGAHVLDLLSGSDELRRAFESVEIGGEQRAEFSLVIGGEVIEVGMVLIRPAAQPAEEIAFVLVFRDLAWRRQYEMELRRVERLAALGQMMAGFAHEIRNPLAAIRALSDAMLAEMSPDDSRCEYLQRMGRVLARINHLVQTSLRLGQPKPPQRTRCAVRAMISEAFDVLGPSLRIHGSMPLVQGGDVCDVHVDERQIVETLLALLENAIESTGDASRVRVVLSPGNGSDAGQSTVHIAIVDDGPGVPAHLISHVFDPFYTTKAKGTGLGLSIAQMLVRDNGGHLLLKSVPNVETNFTLVLPAVQE